MLQIIIVLDRPGLIIELLYNDECHYLTENCSLMLFISYKKTDQNLNWIEGPLVFSHILKDVDRPNQKLILAIKSII